jgi:hypothetical protein
MSQESTLKQSLAAASELLQRLSEVVRANPDAVERACLALRGELADSVDPVWLSPGERVNFVRSLADDLGLHRSELMLLMSAIRCAGDAEAA